MANLTLRSTKGAPLTHSELDGNFEYFTGSIDAINDATSSFLTSEDTASFITSADTGSFVTTAQTASFVTSAQTSSLNISDTLYTVNTALSASVTSSSTTSVCIYGVNVFEYVTPTNFATKLPQPTTGKSVTVINNSTSLLYIYPSNVGGRTNNYPIDTPAILPPDGKPYEFICIKNPLPGEWTFSSPATGQYDSGEIEISITALTKNGYNPVITAYDSNYVGAGPNFNSTNWGYNGKNKPSILSSTYGGNYYLAFRPETPWKGITKIKIYTNLINSNQTRATLARIAAGGESDYYSPYDGSILNTRLGSANGELLRVYTNKVISGVATTGSTAYTSANIGDAGTLWGEKVANIDSYSNVSLGGEGGTFIGNKPLNPTAYPYTQTWDASDNEINTGDIVDVFYSSYISFQIQPFAYDFDYGTIPDFKFRFIIEYYQ
jgi:hypothetical protein